MRRKSAKQSAIPTDILIVGGHQAGLSLAALLGSRGFNVICLERGAPDKKNTSDGRTVALSLRSAKILQSAGVWNLFAHAACPIKDIRIADQASHAALDFNHQEVSAEPFGWIVENSLFLAALLKRLRQLKSVKLVTGAEVAALAHDEAQANVTLNNGQVFSASLVVGADGRTSMCRELAGIETYGWDYQQTALICNIAHQYPHHNIAVEHFLPGGPFAVLPMTDGKTTGTHFTCRSSIVWTESRDAAACLMQLDDEDFADLLQGKVEPYLGKIVLATKRQAYPLQLQHAKTYIAPRLALIGDAAHGIHPIAGQGFNLGMGDIEALAEILTAARALGLDLGGADLLRRYERSRKFDNGTMVLATDVLDRLFSNAVPPVQAARRFGLGLVQRLPRLKRYFMRTAMGLARSEAA